jgi:hypothetical protein
MFGVNIQSQYANGNLVSLTIDGKAPKDFFKGKTPEELKALITAIDTGLAAIPKPPAKPGGPPLFPGADTMKKDAEAVKKMAQDELKKLEKQNPAKPAAKPVEQPMAPAGVNKPAIKAAKLPEYDSLLKIATRIETIKDLLENGNLLQPPLTNVQRQQFMRELKQKENELKNAYTRINNAGQSGEYHQQFSDNSQGKTGISASAFALLIETFKPNQ